MDIYIDMLTLEMIYDKNVQELTSVENGAVFVPIFHPNYLILKPAAKRDVWTALQNVQNILKNA